MVNSSSRVILPPLPPGDLLGNLLGLMKEQESSPQSSPPITLMICSSRTAFLSTLAQDLVSSASPDEEARLGREDTPATPLMTPTIAQIKASSRIKTHFITTVTHLRALLSVWEQGWPESVEQPKHDPTPSSLASDTSNGQSLLVIYGLVALHRHTSDWSAQGFSSTLSAAVELGWRKRTGIVLVEEPYEDREGDEEMTLNDEMDDDEFERLQGDSEDDDAEDFGTGRNLLGELRAARRDQDQISTEQVVLSRSKREWWDESIPILNGSTRRDGTGLESRWNGRTVEVGRVLSRWFDFGNEQDWNTILPKSKPSLEPK